MKSKRGAISGFYFITDSTLSKQGNQADVASAIRGGATIVQYREKNKGLVDFIREALELKSICDQHGTIFLINDNVAAALLVDADGVHLGQDDMPLARAREILGKDKIIGVTVHNRAEAREAEQHGADYLGLSPIFPTSTKRDAGPATGLNLIKTIRCSAKLPCVAIGGINENNVDAVIAAGADAVAAVSATVGQGDVESAVRAFAQRWRA